MIKLVKGDAVKFIDPKSSLFDRLEHDGWKRESVPDVVEKVEDNIEALRIEAKALGIDFHHRAGEEKLKALIAEAKAEG